MADFGKAFQITILGNEGSYNPGIGEKETYMGIDRGANANWSGWAIIDGIKKENLAITVHQMNVLLPQNAGLQYNIRHFYQTNYWDAVNLDKVNDQQLANNLFDCAVNQGEGLARRLMQKAVNQVISSLNSIIKPLIVDCRIGPLTLSAFNGLPAAALNAALNTERLASYKTDSGFAQWGKVWEKRLLNYT